MAQDTAGRNEQAGFFDDHPLTIGGFVFTATAATPAPGDKPPTVRGWQTAMAYASGSEESAPYWVGDLLNYASGRADWRAKLDQMKTVTRLAEQTLHNRAHVARKVKDKARQVAQTMTHAAEVASVPDEADQVEWLTKSREEGWTYRELRVNLSASKRRKVISGQAALDGMYRVIYADPPWSYQDATPRPGGSHKRASEHYATLSIADICKFPVAAHALPNAVLFLWVTSPLLMQNPGPREVLEAWGFTYKASFVWDKVNGMPGSYNRVNHEHLLVCTRGIGTPDRPTPQPDSVFVEQRGDQHSGKPASVRHLIERLYDGPYLELFARERVEGWSCFGDDSKLWAEEASA